MLAFSAAQIAQAEHDRFFGKADRALAARVPEWAQSGLAERREFVERCLARAAGYGMASEQSVMAYALAALWMGLGFEDESPLLKQLLRAPAPELRKAHGLSEWVADQLGPVATPASGDAAIRRSFALTEPWGRT